ncbi:MAG TPA: 4-(cytidine 5'-diphospho)-2-C-methyl-D-erythritol kinase, partial [Dysgonomonas sp.]|nr:4-(cytidine 5'-diphospho)-2-C-methyl-D-erythritol kinase [Dysgonomonas sp.]
KPGLSLKEIIKLPVAEWKDKMYNDFERSVFPQYPVIKEIKEKLYNLGAVYASMSGSGSSVYGIFDNPLDIRKYFPDYYVWQQNEGS